MMTAKPEDLLRELFAAALAAADPAKVVAPHLPKRPKGRCLVVGAGKASAAMAAAVEKAWCASRICWCASRVASPE